MQTQLELQSPLRQVNKLTDTVDTLIEKVEHLEAYLPPPRLDS